MAESRAAQCRHLPREQGPLPMIARIRKPFAILLVLFLLFHWTMPAFAQTARPPRPPAGAKVVPLRPAAPPAEKPDTPLVPPGKDKGPGGPEGPGETTQSMGAEGGAVAPPGTFNVQAFQTDLFTGAATAEVPIGVAPGTAGAAPKVTLRYNSSALDEMGPDQQGPWTGLGWTLDMGGVILRDPKGTTTTSDDTFKLIFGGAVHDLVLIDAPQNLYHTKDETFWKLQYNSSQDYWTLTTKDGTLHRFGFNTDSRAITRGQDLVTPITYKYLLDEVTTPSGTAVRYGYAKQGGSFPGSGQPYDQAVYPDTITYTYYSGAPVGPAREVHFFRAPRTDYSESQVFFERERLDAIEVRVAGNLVRKYAFTFDYSIDRIPGTWGGGAAGDLTLREVRQYGTDGVSALPPLTFTYTGTHLASVTNGIGGRVEYDYQQVATLPLYSVYKRSYQQYDPNLEICFDFGVSNTPTNPICNYSDGGGPVEAPRPAGHALTTNLPGTIPIYSETALLPGTEYCDFMVRTGTPSECTQMGFPRTWVGYAFPPTSPTTQGTVPLYSVCKQVVDYGTYYQCWDYGVGLEPGAPPYSTFATVVGYVYPAKMDRYRVTARRVLDGRGTTASTTFSYGNLGVGSDGKEFRGHDWVRAVDPAGHYTDTWFYQDDAKKGRAYRVETHQSGGALFTKVENTWTTTSPYAGVTFTALTRMDASTYDGDASFKQIAQTFQYDAYGNPIQVQHLGKVGVSGDERTEVTEYFPNASAHIVGLPGHAATLDAAGATVAQTWIYYDGATDPTTPPTLGRLTRKCQWLSGGTNPCVSVAHDAYGNVTTTTDARGNATTTTYDTTYHTFPETVTSPPTANVPQGLVTTSTYDARFGLVLTATDPNGRTTTHAYDIFGRLTSTTNPLGETRTLSYDALGTVGSQRVTTRLPDGSGDGLWAEAYFDGLGRTFKVRKEAAAGQVILLETTFDTRGLVSQKSLPRFEGASPLWTTFAYDALARPTQTTFPDGTTETLAHNDWTFTLTDRNGRTRTSVKDAYGRVRLLTEPGGAVTTYTYDALGRLTSVTDAAGNVTTLVYDTLGRKVSMTEPNMGAWSYGYDATGNLTSQTDARGQTLTFAYDALNRLSTKTYPGGATINFTYDTGTNGKGRRSTMTDAAGSETYTYDALGRTASVTRVTDGVPYTTQSTYTALGQPATITYPDGEVLTYTYDAGGQVYSVVGSTTYVASLTYDAAGHILQVTLGNGVVTTHTYGATTLRLTSLVTTKDATTLQSFGYAYDNVGNITTLTDNRTPANSQTFTYDALDRLVSATGSYGSHSYSYNTIGNILIKAGVTYTYGATAQTCSRLMPHAVTSTSDGKSYTYDCNGNMLSDGERTLTWDADNKPVSITRTGVGTTTFAYSGDGARVKKVGPTKTIRYIGGFEDQVTDGVQVKHFGVGGVRIATRVVGGTNAGTYFTHGDHLGSLNVLTNSSGTEVQRLTYLPFGETHSNSGSVDFHQRRYTGQEQDPETGLYFYQARYYNPVLGRFLSPDPVVPGAGNPQSLNRYTYVNNNPVNFTDPSGHFLFFLPVVVGMVIGYAAAELTAVAIIGGIIGGAAAGAVSTAIYGGNPARNVLVGAALGGLGAAVASPLAGALAGPMGSEAAGAVASATVTGAVVGGVGAAIYGGNVLEGILAGAITAAAFAVATQATVQLAQQNESQALEEGGPPNWGAPRRLPGEYPRDLPMAESRPLAEDGLRITSGYRVPGHPGLDETSIPRSWRGETVYTTDSGRITAIGTERHGINYFTLTTNHGVEVTYMHVTPLGYVTEGMRVIAGQGIGMLDSSGQAAGLWSGYHLHIQTTFEGKYFNPRFYLGYY